MIHSTHRGRWQRAAIHAAIGAGLGLFASLAWSGWLVVSGQYLPAQTVAEVRAWMAPPVATQRLALEANQEPMPPCHLGSVGTLSDGEAH